MLLMRNLGGFFCLRFEDPGECTGCTEDRVMSPRPINEVQYRLKSKRIFM